MSWSDNFPVYLANLSPVYIFSVLISVIALLVTVLYQKHIYVKSENFNSEERKEQDETEDDIDATRTPLIMGEFGGVVGKIKAAKQKVIMKRIQGDDYSLEQDELEKKTEAQQLQAIWELLKKQEDKFQVGTKQEMEEQLQLYRS